MPNMDKYIYEMALAIDKDSDASKKRALPVTAKEVNKISPLTALEMHILKWPPRDVRYEPEYLKNHTFYAHDSLVMKDVWRGMETRIIKRVPTQNIIVVGVYFQTNMAEYAHYNDLVNQHNNAWKKAGCPYDIFDPATGDILPLRDQHIREAYVDTPFISKVDIPEPSDGELANAKPKVKRAKYIEVIYKLDLQNDMFTLSYVVINKKEEILYYNQVKHTNLAYLTRRATQEIFGHPEIHGQAGPLLDGISLLIKGKKLHLCKKNNRVPYDIMQKCNIKHFKSPTPTAIATGIDMSLYSLTIAIMGYLIPIIACWMWILASSVGTFIESQQKYGDPDIKMWAYKLVGAIIIVFLSGKIAHWAKEKKETLRLKSKYI